MRIGVWPCALWVRGRSEIMSSCDSDKVGLVTFCKIERRLGMAVLSALRRGPEGCEFKDSQFRHQGPASETRDGGMERRREGQREAAMRLSFDFCEISLFQQGVNCLTHAKSVSPPQKKIENRRTFFLPQPPSSFLPVNRQKER